MYQKRVKNIVTGETGIVVSHPQEDCPNLLVAPDNNPTLTVCWPKSDCVVVS